MLILILGIVLWIAFHVFKRVVPEKRATFGDAGKGIIAVGIFAGLTLIIIGYRAAPVVPIWSPPEIFIHINNLLMVLAAVLLAMSVSKGRMSGRMRHPMLNAVKTWAVAHLMVNGDLASILMFGGILAWAIWNVTLINKAETWEKPEITDNGRDWVFLAAAVGFFALMVAAHLLLGVHPFAAR